MVVKKKNDQLTRKEFKWYVYGTSLLTLLIFITYLVGSFFPPLILLQIRLSIIGFSTVYFLTIFIFYYWASNKGRKEEKEANEIIIIINGKEVARG